jgi:sulfopyruvate decarboxylase TPP-binding subunit
MPTARIPSVEIEFGGETRHLIFGHHALGELEEQASCMAGTSKIKSVILALWAGLLTETLDARGRETKRTLSRFEVAAILDKSSDEDIEAIAAKIEEARQLAHPPKPEKPENPTPASSSPSA